MKRRTFIAFLLALLGIRRKEPKWKINPAWVNAPCEMRFYHLDADRWEHGLGDSPRYVMNNGEWVRVNTPVA